MVVTALRTMLGSSHRECEETELCTIGHYVAMTNGGRKESSKQKAHLCQLVVVEPADSLVSCLLDGGLVGWVEL